MKISVYGTGYVGLVTGSCFSEMGNTVTCMDIDESKIDGLKEGILPIYEPGLEQLVQENYREKRLKFTASIKTAAANSSCHFIAVGTPPKEDGSADLQHVLEVARQIGQNLQQKYNVIVDKSTVPVGTAEKVAGIIQDELDNRGVSGIEFDVVSNPEFLKEGTAIADFMHPDRVIIGTDSARAEKIMHGLYSSFTRVHDRVMAMGIREAEMTKYAANAMLATKISYINEIASLCEELGVDVEQVREGIGADKRIGYHFIYPGCGYGGSCFPKDIRALQRMAEEVGFTPHVLNAVEARNTMQKESLFNKINTHFGGDLQGKTIALWGLSFKPGTDDMREAPSLVLIRSLLKAGASVQAHDPVANQTAREEMDKQWIQQHRIRFFDHQYDALNGADALALVTEWKPFRNPDYEVVMNRLHSPVIFDGRNQYNPKHLKESGFRYYGIGR
ncbi:UDP-glucose dehydrogenase family protein [Thiolapillus sp.]